MAHPQLQPEPSWMLARAPAELTHTRLRRIGEGIGKVVYASDHWVVKRERSRREIIALIIIWKMLSKVGHVLPGHLGDRLLRRPSRLIRLLRVIMQGIMLILPRSIWITTHIFEIWKNYRSRDRRGERLANTYLSGTRLVPKTIKFPPARVDVGGWPGWLVVCEATERVEETLDARLTRLAGAGEFDQVENWLNRFLELRQSGWAHGLFSLDAHLKNFGICGDHIVLLDPGGLTNRWDDVEEHLSALQAVVEPHLRLGLGPLLESRPDIAARFDTRWKATVNRAQVLRQWPDDVAS